MKSRMLGAIMAVILFSNHTIATDTNKTVSTTKTPFSNVLDKRERQVMSKFMAEDFKNYEKQLKKDYGISDAKLSLSLVSRVNDLRKKNSDPNKQEDHNMAYCATWKLCIDTMKKTKDAEVKKLILENWNSYLKKDDKSVPYQLYAIRTENWDPNRGLLTEDFWKLFEQTKNKKTFSAICRVIYAYGNRDDAQRLLRMKNSGIDMDSKSIIQSTVNWMNWRLMNGNMTNNPPTPMVPRMTFKDDDNLEQNSKSVQK